MDNDRTKFRIDKSTEIEIPHRIPSLLQFQNDGVKYFSLTLIVYHERLGKFRAYLNMESTKYTRKEYRKASNKNGKEVSQEFIALIKNAVKQTWDRLITYSIMQLP